MAKIRDGLGTAPPTSEQSLTQLVATTRFHPGRWVLQIVPRTQRPQHSRGRGPMLTSIPTTTYR